MADPGRSYEAKIVRWVDGDTVWLDVDLGFRTTIQTDFRLYGVNTPERGQAGWAEAGAFVKATAPEGTLVSITSFKNTEKYGRWLANITVHGQASSINDALIAAKLAAPYFGGKK